MSHVIPPEFKTSPGGFSQDVLAELSKTLAADGAVSEVITVTSSTKDAKEGTSSENISFQGTTASRDSSGQRSKDTCKLIYVTMILHGVGTLMPWNMFITANDYFVKYKLSIEYTGKDTDYGDNFLSYVGLAAQLPAFCFHWANIFVQFGGNLNKRIVYSLGVQLLVFIFTIILAAVDTSDSPEVFFWLTMGSVVVLNVVGGIYQNCIFGIGAKLGCIGGLVLGTNVSGTFTSVVSLISLACAPTEVTAAIFYFSSALVLIVACLVTYLLLPHNKFYRHRMEMLKEPSTCGTGELHAVEEGGDTSSRGTHHHNHSVTTTHDIKKKSSLPYRHILRQCGAQCFNIFFIFFVTLTIFPSIHSQIKPLDEEFPIPDKYFEPVTCFLTFNLFALIGNLVAEVVQWPTAGQLWIPVTSRLIFIPFFLLCNYQPHAGRSHVHFVFNDWIYWIGGMMLGFTSGYFCSLSMIYCPKSVSREHATIAGMFAIAFLVSGIIFGIGFSWIISSNW